MAGSGGLLRAILVAGYVLLAGCAAQSSAGPPPPAATQKSSILAASTPAAGSTVAGPVNELKLRFSPPARLDQVTVSGPDGTMPMMVTAVGEVPDYSIPLPGLGAGAYTVNWRAGAQGKTYDGAFQFTVK